MTGFMIKISGFLFISMSSRHACILRINNP
jgi:hypothetical protein